MTFGISRPPLISGDLFGFTEITLPVNLAPCSKAYHSHSKLMKEVYEWLLTEKGKGIILSGWRSASIEKTLKMARFRQVTPTFRILHTIVSSTWLSFVQF